MLLDATPLSKSLSGEWICQFCSFPFKSKQGLAVHQYHKHGIKSIMRMFVGLHSHCLCCLLEFHTRERLVRHLSDKSKFCKQYMLDSITPLSVEVADEYDRACNASELRLNVKLGYCRSFTKNKPAYRLVGPLPCAMFAGNGTGNYGRNKRLIGEVCLPFT